MRDLVRTFWLLAGVLTVCLAVGLPLAAAEGEVDYNQPPLTFEPPLFMFTLVLFLLFLFVMRKTVWSPLIANLNQREARVVDAERHAKQALHEAERLRQECERRLAEVQEQVKHIVAQARSEAEARKLEIVAQAEQDAQRIKAEALDALAQARNEALDELSRIVDEHAMAATEHIAGRRL